MITQKNRTRWIASVVVVVVGYFALFHYGIWNSYRSGRVAEDDVGGWTRQHLSGHTPAGGFSSEAPKQDSTSSCPPSQPSEVVHAPPVVDAIVDKWDFSRMLKGAPTEKFKDNLLDDQHYITAWSNAGFTNQFISYVNMIYLGMLSERVPIIPPFGPDHHISYGAGALPFGRIFNLSQARQTMQQPLLEWIDVKALPSPTSLEPPLPEEREHIGCWSARHESDPNPSRVRSVVDNLRLDITYTRMVNKARHNINDKTDDFLDFSHVVPYIFPNDPRREPWGDLPIMQDSPLGYRLPPDEHMACFDHLYYVTSSHDLYEWRYSWSPAWRRVATFLHFTDELMDLTKGYIARAFQTTVDEIPPFIGVHIRRGDFLDRCDNPFECTIPLEAYRDGVDRVRDELMKKHNRVVKEVIIMSDDTDPEFWDEMNNIGWARLDHDKEMTLEKHGEWYPPIIDQVAHSTAAGFVGTEDSTYSLVGARRVTDWNNGPTVIIDVKDL